MFEITTKNSWPLFRIIIPVSSGINIYTRPAKKTTALGPVMLATVANKLNNWRVEVIDENNYRKGPRDDKGLPDHKVLQEENPAAVVGFYCGISSTIERVWQIAEFYKGQKAFTLAGSRHADYFPEETLNHNIDLVVHGDGETIIQTILKDMTRGGNMKDIPGTSYLEGGQLKTNAPEELAVADLNKLPYPDFGLVRFAKIVFYPIGRIRGCSMNCEFCSVKGKPRWANARYLFNVVKWLVETRGARYFFLVDDRSEDDERGTFEFYRMIAEKYRDRLTFVVQTRLGIAKKTELIKAMKMAGVKRLFIGFESPVDQELTAMRKGYLCSQMLEWTRILRRYFCIHAMWIFNYPLRDRGESITVQEMVRRYKKFIRSARLDSIQILFAIPLPGTELRQRLEQEGRIFPLNLVPWKKYDGNFICFAPDNMSVRELQYAQIKLMKWFYSPFSFFGIPLRTLAFPVDYLIRGWKNWYRDWWRDIIKYGGYLLVKKWQQGQKEDGFVDQLEEYLRNQRTS